MRSIIQSKTEMIWPEDREAGSDPYASQNPGPERPKPAPRAADDSTNNYEEIGVRLKETKPSEYTYIHPRFTEECNIILPMKGVMDTRWTQALQVDWRVAGSAGCRKAYRKLALFLHPDKSPGANPAVCTQAFDILQEALSWAIYFYGYYGEPDEMNTPETVDAQNEAMPPPQTDVVVEEETTVTADPDSEDRPRA